MKTLHQIDIPKRGGFCAGKGERLLPGMDYYSLLLEDDQRQVIRQDFCSACWGHQEASSYPNSRGYWKSKIEQKKEELGSSRFQKALVLLKQLLREESQQEDELFVLAIFLCHARKLALRQEFEREGERWGLYEIIHEDEFLTIKQLSMPQMQIERLQKTLAEKLK